MKTNHFFRTFMRGSGRLFTILLFGIALYARPTGQSFAGNSLPGQVIAQATIGDDQIDSSARPNLASVPPQEIYIRYFDPYSRFDLGLMPGGFGGVNPPLASGERLLTTSALFDSSRSLQESPAARRLLDAVTPASRDSGYFDAWGREFGSDGSAGSGRSNGIYGGYGADTPWLWTSGGAGGKAYGANNISVGGINGSGIAGNNYLWYGTLPSLPYLPYYPPKSGSSGARTFPVNPVPEPATAVLLAPVLLCGVLFRVCAIQRRRNAFSFAV